MFKPKESITKLVISADNSAPAYSIPPRYFDHDGPFNRGKDDEIKKLAESFMRQIREEGIRVREARWIPRVLEDAIMRAESELVFQSNPVNEEPLKKLEIAADVAPSAIEDIADSE